MRQAGLCTSVVENMSGIEFIWFPLYILAILLLRLSSPLIGSFLVEADLDTRKKIASDGLPEQAESAIILSLNCPPAPFQLFHYYIDFLLPSQNTVITCEVSRRLYNTLHEGQSGILTYQGTAFRSFLRNGEIIYDKC